MKVDLSRLFDSPGQTQPVVCELDLSDVKRWGSRLFGGPVKICGQAENRSGIVSLHYTVNFILDVVCDRCLTPLITHQGMEFSHIMVLSLNREDNDEFIVIPDGQLDLAELVTADILLELPTSMVCDPGCKGLCPVCGANLNAGDCGCNRQMQDSRLDKLRELLEE
ncbi:MAG: DUF177 domain-containing protein [Anaerotruncus sp.]|nr:DUF177 domain-containing protein [Anaerotruncus sp.]